MNDFLTRVRIILARPEGSENIGASCRAMKNMGIGNLTIVNPERPIDVTEVKKRALHAFDVWERATHARSLEEALAGSIMAAGVTRRTGNRRNQKALSPELFASEAAKRTGGWISLIFGNEQHGLTTQELSHCSHVVSIPSSPDFPSLNLSHAVQILAYALFTCGASHGAPTNRAQRDAILPVVSRVSDTLKSLGFFKLSDASYAERFVRDIFMRAGVRTWELSYIAKTFDKIKHLSAQEAGETDSAEDPATLPGQAQSEAGPENER